MIDFLITLATIVAGLGVFGAVLAGLYGLASFLPRTWRERAHIGVFIGPALILLFVGLLIPAARTMYMSVHSDDRTTRHFVGLKHYGEIFSGAGDRLVVINNLTWVVVGTLGTTLFSLTVARFADGIKGEKVAKSLMFIPTAVSLAGAGIIWRFVYAAPPFKVGLLNQVTKAVPGLPANMGGNGDQNWVLERGLGGITPPDNAPGFNTFLLIIIFIWASAGFSTVVLSAAIKGVPESLIEAAKVDGATNRQVFYKVTLPYIRSTIVTVMTLSTIAALKAFDIVEAVTGGNFGTSLLATEYLTTTYLEQREGLGAALACLILLLVIPVVVINRRSQRRAEELMGA